jgi:tRNA pseudouridine38-40 synthase
MRTLKLTIAYDGSDFAGWQYQAGLRTIQGAIEQTIAKITGEKLRVSGSGRTDAGVHALGQVASFRTESMMSTAILHRALIAELPPAIVISAVEEAPDGFHATRDAVSKRYRYVLHDGRLPSVFDRRHVWRIRSTLDDAAMRRAAEPLVGEHDFISFESSGSRRDTTVRTVSALSIERGVDERADYVTLEIEADGFLYNMVRTITGTLVEVGRGRKPESWAAEALAARDRRAAGPKAPPQGLFLVHVKYD